MYGRKIQLVKKKKSGLSATAKSTGSNWGPRIALYEREQQQQQLLEGETKSGHYGSASTSTYSQSQPPFRNPVANWQNNRSQNNSENNYPVIGKYMRNGNVNGNVKPLKVIIPPPEQFHYDKRHLREIDSLPSTETWRSSENDDNDNDDGQSNSMTRTTVTVIASDDDDDNEDNAREMTPLCKCDSPAARKSSSPKNNSKNRGIGYPTTAKASMGQQGFSMVYVPMETSVVRRPKLLSPADYNAGQSSCSIDAPTPTSSAAAVPKDPDNDSLLESFDSVIFKPKSSPIGGGKFLKQKRDTPPPLPPKNSPTSPAGVKVNKSLRFADNLPEKVMKRNSPPLPPPPPDVNVKVAPVGNGMQKRQKPRQRHVNANVNIPCHGNSDEAEGEKFPFADNDGDDDEANFAYTTCKSESEPLTLTCGHARDDYSTLSSIQSQDRQITPPLPAEEERAASSNHSGSPKPPKSEKSALQQLRDLSLLIGGSFHTPEDEEALKKSRKSSDATSADSGKGSAPDTEITAGDMPSNSNCSCAESTCIFRPECEECQMFFKNPFEKPPNCTLDGDYGLGGSRRKISGSHSTSAGSSASNNSSKNSKKGKYRKKVSKPEKPLLILPPTNASNLNCGCGACDNFKAKCAKGCGSGGGGMALTKTQFLLRKSELSKKPFRGTGNKRSPGGNSNSSSGNSVIDPILFTIDEEEDSNSGLGQRSADNKSHSNRLSGMTSPEQRAQMQDDEEEERQHFHPKCWLAPDATMGWSDLESLYSQNMKREQPVSVNGECWTCWKEMSQFKYNSPESNRTVDRTKRMFIWLNKRPKEFNAPWWEAKKQASIKWLTSKAYAHMPNSPGALQDPFKESKRDKSKFRMREEITSGLANGKLYCMALDNLYQKNREKRAQGLSHWEIIKILSRRGVYVAQPSDMKLTEGTLRQKKPLRIAAHIALIEAIMGLYAKELVSRERILPILKNLGQDLDTDVDESPEHLIIAWINSAIHTIKAYVLTNGRNKSLKLTQAQIQRWLRIPPVSEIRDLNDGVGICCLMALYFSGDIKLEEIGIGVGEPADEPLNIYEMILNHTLAQKMCHSLFPEKIYHLCVTDFLYIHGYMKQNILSFLIDLFYHLEVNPVPGVNRLTHVPLRVQL